MTPTYPGGATFPGPDTYPDGGVPMTDPVLIGPGPMCSVGDVQERLGRVLTAPELERVGGLIAEASALVQAYLGCPLETWIGPDEDGDLVPDTVPAAVRIVTSRMVARVLTSPVANVGAEVTQQTVGPFSTTWGAGTTSGAPWLSATDRETLAPYRCGSGLSVATLAGEQNGFDGGGWWWGELEEGEHPVVWVDATQRWWIVGRPQAWRP